MKNIYLEGILQLHQKWEIDCLQYSLLIECVFYLLQFDDLHKKSALMIMHDEGMTWLIYALGVSMHGAAWKKHVITSAITTKSQLWLLSRNKNSAYLIATHVRVGEGKWVLSKKDLIWLKLVGAESENMARSKNFVTSCAEEGTLKARLIALSPTLAHSYIGPKNCRASYLSGFPSFYNL